MGTEKTRHQGAASYYKKCLSAGVSPSHRQTVNQADAALPPSKTGFLDCFTAFFPACRKRRRKGDPVPETPPEDLSGKLHVQILGTFLSPKPSCSGCWELPSRARQPHPRATRSPGKKGRRGFCGQVVSSITDSPGTFPPCTASALVNLMTKSVLCAGIRLSMACQPLIIRR